MGNGAGLAGNGNNGINTALNNGAMTYDTTKASSYTVTEGGTTATITLASGLSDTTALASINSQLKNAGITDITAVANGAGTAGAYSLQSASTFTDTLVAANGGTASVGAVAAADVVLHDGTHGAAARVQAEPCHAFEQAMLHQRVATLLEADAVAVVVAHVALLDHGLETTIEKDAASAATVQVDIAVA